MAEVSEEEFDQKGIIVLDLKRPSRPGSPFPSGSHAPPPPVVLLFPFSSAPGRDGRSPIPGLCHQFMAAVVVHCPPQPHEWPIKSPTLLKKRCPKRQQRPPWSLQRGHHLFRPPPPRLRRVKGIIECYIERGEWIPLPLICIL